MQGREGTEKTRHNADLHSSSSRSGRKLSAVIYGTSSIAGTSETEEMFQHVSNSKNVSSNVASIPIWVPKYWPLCLTYCSCWLELMGMRTPLINLYLSRCDKAVKRLK